MFNYILRRLLLLPLTLFCIIIINFVIVNMAPGDPTSVTELSPEGGATRRSDRAAAFGTDDRYLQFREFYGLTLPILINPWPWTTQKEVDETLWILTNRKESPESTQEINFKEYDRMRIRFGDMSRFIMPHLLQVIENPKENEAIRNTAIRFFVRGGTRQGFLGANLSEEKKNYNRKVANDNNFLNLVLANPLNTPEEFSKVRDKLRRWYDDNKDIYHFAPSFSKKIWIFFFETRFCRYMSRVLTLDFGTMRNDANKSVINEVSRRFKYSLTLSILPLMITFVVCQIFGCLMAVQQNKWTDYSLNVFFLILYAIPVFVVAPFLIEIALNRDFPFTNTQIPLSGFTSPDNIYDQKTSSQRLFDVIQHIFLPIIAIMYGSLAAEARLSRTAVLEVLRQDYIRTAKAKGLSNKTILLKHVGRNAAITIVTSIAGSLGIVLGGSLIVETLFEINGFGKFFYDAILNRDYNVIMFSALAGSFLTLLGYLVADIAYTILDPRLTLD